MNNSRKAGFSALVLAIIVLASCGSNSINVPLKTKADSASYYMGYLSGKQLSDQGMDELNARALAKGWEDAQKGLTKEEKSDEDLSMFIQQYFMSEQQNAQEKMAKKNEVYLKEGQDFLVQNKTKQGIVTLPSGLQYKIIKEGTGIKPAREDQVDVVYHGSLIDGYVFDSSKDSGDTVTFPVSGVVPGFTEALTLMNEGSVWEVYIPSELGYGSTNRGGPIKPNSVLIFEINLVKVKKAESEGDK